MLIVDNFSVEDKKFRFLHVSHVKCGISKIWRISLFELSSSLLYWPKYQLLGVYRVVLDSPAESQLKIDFMFMFSGEGCGRVKLGVFILPALAGCYE